MAITLKKATREDIETIWKMQVEAFTELLDKYQDFDMSPATESLEKIIAKFEQPWTTYYYIVENDIVVGAVRIDNMFFASTFWQKLQNIFGECCISKLEKVAKPQLAAVLPVV